MAISPKSLSRKAKALCLAFLAVCALPAFAASVDDLEAITRKAGSLDEFLANKELTDDYFQKLVELKGKSRVSHEAYEGILAQLRVVVAKVPELKARLWESTGLGQEISLQISSSFPYTVDAEKWKKFYASFQDGLSTSAGGAKPEEIKRLVSSLGEMLEAELAQLPTNLAKNQRLAASAEIFKKYKTAPETRKVAAYFIQRFLARADIKQQLEGGNSALILDALDQFWKGIKTDVVGNENLPTFVLGAVAEMVPAREKTLAQADIFQPRMFKTTRGEWVRDETIVQPGTLRFQPQAKRFHGAMKGLELKECVGGDKVCELTLERTLTSALKDTQISDVIVNGQSSGFVQAVPIRNRAGQVDASVDFGSYVFRHSAVVVDPTTGRKRGGEISHFWLEEALKNKPTEWDGFVVSEGSAINNAGAVNTVRLSADYLTGKTVGTVHDYQIMDPLAQKIIGAIPPQGVAELYAGNMIFDGSIRTDFHGGGRLTQLKPSEQQETAAIFRATADPLLRKRVAWALGIEGRPISDADILIELAREIGDSDVYDADKILNVIAISHSQDPRIYRELAHQLDYDYFSLTADTSHKEKFRGQIAMLLRSGRWERDPVVKETLKKFAGEGNVHSVRVLAEDLLAAAAWHDPASVNLQRALNESSQPTVIEELQPAWKNIERRSAVLNWNKADYTHDRTGVSTTLQGTNPLEHGKAELAKLNWIQADRQISEWVRKGVPMTSARMFELNGILGEGLAFNGEKGGNQRQIPVGVLAEDKSGVQFALAHEDLDKSVELLDKWIAENEKKLPPVQFAAELYQRVISTHMFPDANGRTSLLVTDWALEKYRLPPLIHGLEDLKMKLMYFPEDWMQPNPKPGDGLRMITRAIEMSLDEIERHPANGGCMKSYAHLANLKN